MADTTKTLAQDIATALLANTAVMALVSNRVYTRVPQNATFPYIEVSLTSGDYSGMDFTGMEHTVTVHCYSQLHNIDEAGDMKAAVYNALNRNEALSLSSGHLASINYNGVGYLGLDSDSVTQLGIVQFRAVVT